MDFIPIPVQSLSGQPVTSDELQDRLPHSGADES